MGKYYVGWEIPAVTRNRLLWLFPPRYPDVIAHHVTLTLGVREDCILPTATEGVIVGVADDGAGVQALVIEIDGSTTRPDGQTFHVTWSLNRSVGAKPVHSNKVIRERGYTPCERTVITLTPKLFETAKQPAKP